MSDIELRNNIKEFMDFWRGKGYEKGESQQFWISFLTKVLGITEPEKFIEFEDKVKMDNSNGFIDGYIPSTKVLIEQKSINVNLRSGIRQSDGSLKTPYQQASAYIMNLPVSKHPKYVITCNFKSFLIYDMENPNGEPDEILLEDLDKEYYRFSFIIDNDSKYLKKEMEVSFKAGEIVGTIYDELLKMYANPENEESLKSLNMLCVRLVFCLYAEDAGLFGKHLMFHDYLERFEARDLRRALIDLFKVLDTKLEDRDPYIDEGLKHFPYVNGGLFSEEDIEIPNFTNDIKELLLNKASENFDWSEISPTIFGAVFESTLNPETRRSGGMHYTSIENIHKVIDPLFLNDIKEELKEIEEEKVFKSRTKKLNDFQKKISSLKFLDPACGSGNFLTETYLSLRRIENQVIFDLTGGQQVLGDVQKDLIKVDIHQFYGIEINDFAVTVAKTALWIAESQMLKKTEEIINQDIQYLPLKSYSNIIEGNALRINWEEVIERKELNYIMGNPPFSGTKWMDKSSKDDTKLIFDKDWINYGTLDYVACWYKKSAEYIMNTQIRCAFVSTNSICQGEQVVYMWKPLLERYNVHIDFAYRTFIWDSEASIKAHVHCVIIGFSEAPNEKGKIIFNGNQKIVAKNINPYLLDGENVFISARKTPLANIPLIHQGCKFVDGGFLIFTEEEKNDFIKQEPDSIKFFRPYMMGKDFINRKPRYCLWLKDAKPEDLKKCPKVMDRIRAVKEFRENCDSPDTNSYASTPTLPARMSYYSDDQHTDYIAIPIVSSQRRRYIPMELLTENIIAGSKLFVMPNATIYEFGIMTSNVHMAWMRVFTGRLKSDYSYSNGLVYNTFPWPDVDENMREKIEKTAKGIIEARELYPNSSLADLYDELIMPTELRKAHQENDKAVMEAYGFDWRRMSESDCVAELMELHKRIIDTSGK